MWLPDTATIVGQVHQFDKLQILKSEYSGKFSYKAIFWAQNGFKLEMWSLTRVDTHVTFSSLSLSLNQVTFFVIICKHLICTLSFSLFLYKNHLLVHSLYLFLFHLYYILWICRTCKYLKNNLFYKYFCLISNFSFFREYSHTTFTYTHICSSSPTPSSQQFFSFFSFYYFFYTFYRKNKNIF